MNKRIACSWPWALEVLTMDIRSKDMDARRTTCSARMRGPEMFPSQEQLNALRDLLPPIRTLKKLKRWLFLLLGYWRRGNFRLLVPLKNAEQFANEQMNDGVYGESLFVEVKLTDLP